MLSRISNLGGGKFGVENAISNLEFGGWKIWGGKCYLEISNLGGGVENLGWKMLSRISNLGGVENLGWKMLSRISNLGGGKFGVENAISNLEFGGWKIWGGKCYLESRIWGVENLGRKMLSRISNLGGGKFGAENAISKFLIWGGGWKIWGGKCYLESRIWGVENLGRKMLSRISNLGGGKFGVENAIAKFLIWGGGVENLGWKMLSRISNLGGVENLGWKMLSRISNLGGVENLGWKMLSRNF